MCEPRWTSDSSYSRPAATRRGACVFTILRLSPRRRVSTSRRLRRATDHCTSPDFLQYSAVLQYSAQYSAVFIPRPQPSNPAPYDPSTTPTGSFEPRPAGCDAPRTTLRPPTFSSIQQYSAVFSSILSSIRQYTAIYPSIANYKPIMGQASCEYIGIYCCILQYIAEGLRCLAAPRYTPIYPSIRLEDVPPISPYIA